MAKGVFSLESIVVTFQRLRARLTGNRPFWIGSAIFFVVFLITRLPHFLYYRSTCLDLDSSGYFMIVDQMNKGFWPNLSIRTIGYPNPEQVRRRSPDRSCPALLGHPPVPDGL